MAARRAAAMLVAATALTVIPAGTAGARTQVTGFTAYDRQVLADINAARAERGVPPLRVSARLQPVANAWAQHMADAGQASNNPRFGRVMTAACPAWRHIGETVGKAGESSADDLFATYMRDSTGRKSLMARKFKLVGISTVTTDEAGSTVRWNAIELADRCKR